MLSNRGRLASVVVLMACAGLAAPALAQFGPVPAGEDLGEAAGLIPKPQIEISATEVNFGEISDEKPVSKKITITNKGKATLGPISVHAGCGCTQPNLTKTMLEPGESTDIDVTYNPHNRRGPQQTTVTVNSNDPASPARQIAVKSVVTPQVYIEPQQASFGNVNKGQGSDLSIEFVSLIPDVKPTGATATNPDQFEATVGETTTKKVNIGGGERDAWVTPVKISIKKDAPVGMIQGSLTFRTTDANRLINTSVFAQIQGDIVSTPQNLMMGVIQPSSPINGEIKVASRNNQPFEITKVETNPLPGMQSVPLDVKFEKDPANPNGYIVRLTGTSPDRPMVMQGEITLYTNVPQEEKVKVNYYGSISNKSVPSIQPNIIRTNPTGGPTGGPAANPPAPTKQ